MTTLPAHTTSAALAANQHGASTAMLSSHQSALQAPANLHTAGGLPLAMANQMPTYQIIQTGSADFQVVPDPQSQHHACIK